MVAGTQKVLFLCNCCITTLVPSLNDQSCCSGTTGRAKKAEWRQNHCHCGSSVAVVAEWRHSGRHSDRSMDAIGRPKEAQWWYKEGRRVAQIDTHIFYWATNGRPLCIHSATTAMCVPSSCLLWATCERPTSSATFVRLFWTCSKLHGDHGVHGDVWTSYVPPLNDQGKRSVSLLPSTATWPFCGRTREAQRSQPLCKGGISELVTYGSRCWLGVTCSRHIAICGAMWLTTKPQVHVNMH